MSYCFRIRFRIGDRVGMETSAEELELASGGDGGERVTLRSSVEGVDLRDADWLSVRGQSYATREEAEAAAAKWATRLRLPSRCYAWERISASAHRTPSSPSTD